MNLKSVSKLQLLTGTHHSIDATIPVPADQYLKMSLPIALCVFVFNSVLLTRAFTTGRRVLQLFTFGLGTVEAKTERHA